jgi:pSer/pThr/pTyr-binding forkhead associated (FHA) protein/S1-C subfamily serine protease
MVMPRIVLRDIDTEKTLSVTAAEAIIGRDPTAGFVIEGPKSKVVSGRHAKVYLQDNAWWIADTSRNGTILDDERLQPGTPYPLRVGQTIGLGDSGPRFKVAALEAKKGVAETVTELPDLNIPGAPIGSTAPRNSLSSAPKPSAAAAAAAAEARTTAMRRSQGVRAVDLIEESTEPAPAPDWVVHAELRLTTTNQQFDVRGDVIKIGRAPECLVQISPELGASVSRVHAEIAIQEGGISLRDPGSRNGTFLNGKRLEAPQALAKGDLIMLGSGGPTFAVEDLHIVKGAQSPSGGAPPGSSESQEATGAHVSATKPPADVPKADAIPATRHGAPAAPDASLTPPTGQEAQEAPRANIAKPLSDAAKLARRSFAGVGRTAFFKDVLEDMSQKSAKRVRVVVWTSVTATVLIAGGVLIVTQRRVTASEQRMADERKELLARADSQRLAATKQADALRSAFDSARLSSAPRAVLDSLRNALADASRRTGVLEEALTRAKQSLNQQLADGDAARKRAEEDMVRLRSEVGKAQSGGEGSRAALDSLRKALKGAEDKATDIASQLRTVRNSNADLAQVAQLNQNAVGLVTMFADTSGAEGSGFAVTPSGYFVTNRHVVTTDSGKTADSVFVTMADQRYGRWSRADVVAVGQGETDIAILKLRGYRGPYIKKVDWASANVHQGEPAALIGFPRGTMVALDSSDVVRTSMSAGIFSKVGSGRIQFDGFSQGGSSGSPVFNANGEVVAVHYAGLRGAVGLGFAIPVSKVVALLPSDAKTELGIR